jgi:hypothetical protein
MKQPQSMQGKTLRRMNQESGGDPAVVNKWDSNWTAGTPSVGLMQVIGPTYRSHIPRGYDVGPYLYGTSINPLANILASMGYAIGEYGSLPAAYDRAGGYQYGGRIAGPGGLDRVPIMATAGEYVIKKETVDMYGPSFFDAINGTSGGSSKPGHYAAGGTVLGQYFDPSALGTFQSGLGLTGITPSDMKQFIADLVKITGMGFRYLALDLAGYSDTFEHRQLVNKLAHEPAKYLDSLNKREKVQDQESLVLQNIKLLVGNIASPGRQAYSLAEELLLIGASKNYIVAAPPGVTFSPGGKSVFFPNADTGFDQGGWLPPGRSTVINKTGAPEPVLTPQQLNALLNNGGSGGSVRLDDWSLQRLAQMLASRPAMVQMDSQVVAKTVNTTGVPGSGAF